MNWGVERDSRTYCCVISGSASGVADCSVLERCDCSALERCDAVLDVSTSRVASIFRVQQPCLTVTECECHTLRLSRWCSINVMWLWMSCGLLHKKFRILWPFLKIGTIMTPTNPQIFLQITQVHAFAIFCNSLYGVNSLITELTYWKPSNTTNI